MSIRDRGEEIINVGDIFQFEINNEVKIGKLVYSSVLDMVYVIADNQFVSLYVLNYDTLLKL